MNVQPSSESGSTQRSEPESVACQAMVLDDGHCPCCRKHVARPRVLRLLARLPGMRQVVRWGYPKLADRRMRVESSPGTDATREVSMARGETFAGDRETNDLTPQGRRTRLAFSIALMVVVLSPVIQNWRADPDDGFPLSYYPMFSHQRGETYRLYHPVGITGDGQRVPLAYGRIGSGGFNAVRRQVREMARGGNKKRLDEYTAAIAERVAASKSRSLRNVDEVRIVRGTYNIDDWFLHGIKLPEKEKILSSAPVLRTNSANSSEKQERNKR